MRKSKFNILVVMMAAVLMSFSYQANAQRNGRGQGQGWNQQNNQSRNCIIPNLTEDQQKKIETMRTAHLKERMQHRNVMAEKRARLNTLRTADKIDMNAINKTIDEMAASRAKMMKKSEAHRQSVRQILTDDQKVYFDSRGGRGFKGGKGQGYGRGQGMRGQGMRGQGRGSRRF
ncbi:MAG: periplasmic heavy metal sensor [Bacteroidota bacterium]